MRFGFFVLNLNLPATKALHYNFGGQAVGGSAEEVMAEN